MEIVMEFSDLVRQRCSIRAFEPAPVDDRQLEVILSAANRAPSAGNLQAYEIYVVKDFEVRKRLAQAALNQDFIAQAPVALVFCAHPQRSSVRYRERGENLYAVQDATIACTFAMLAAADQGLGSVWVGAFHDDRVGQVIDASPGHKPVAILPLGTPAEKPNPSARRQLSDLVQVV
jgi:nitroreductase